MVRQRSKIAKVPENIWLDNKKIAKRFGYEQTTYGFKIVNKILHGDFELRKKRRGKKYVYEFDMGKL